MKLIAYQLKFLTQLLILLPFQAYLTPGICCSGWYHLHKRQRSVKKLEKNFTSPFKKCKVLDMIQIFLRSSKLWRHLMLFQGRRI